MRFNVQLGVNLPAWRSWLFRHAAELIRERETSQLGSASRRPSRPASPAREYLWRYSSPMEELGTRWVPHLVVGSTAHSIQIEASPDLPQEGWHRDRRPGGTYSINRRELQRLGFARVDSGRTVFFSQPKPSDRIVAAIEAVQRLGLWFPFTEEELRRAYRQKARTAHPDAGGSNQRFVRLQEDYRRAREVMDLGR